MVSRMLLTRDTYDPTIALLQESPSGSAGLFLDYSPSVQDSIFSRNTLYPYPVESSVSSILYQVTGRKIRADSGFIAPWPPYLLVDTSDAAIAFPP